MLRCIYCGEASPKDATFCIGCGKALEIEPITGRTTRLTTVNASGAPYVNPFIDYSDRDTGEPLYFIYKNELGGLLKDANTSVKQTEDGYDIYYYGRKIVFID